MPKRGGSPGPSPSQGRAGWRLKGGAWAAVARRALRELEAYEERLNALNVFPVSDWDTGRNLRATLTPLVEAWERVEARGCGLLELVRAAEAALSGARGNSGVILAAFLLEALRSLVKREASLDAEAVAEALRAGAEAARRSVLEPREGTVLTVLDALAREAARFAATAPAALGVEGDEGIDPAALVEALHRAGRAALRRTPEQLPPLARARVVDAGGAGVVVLLQGVLCALRGEGAVEPLGEEELGLAAVPVPALGGDGAALLEPYDLQLTLRTSRPRPELEAALRELGTSQAIVPLPEGGAFRLHVHVRDPRGALRALARLGELADVHVEDMRTQAVLEPQGQAQAQAQAQERGTEAVVAWVSPHEAGFARLFRALGVRVAFDREAFLRAAQRARGLWLLPNAEGLLAQAKAAADGRAGRDVWIVPTKAPTEGLRALLAFDPRRGFEENARAMAEELRRVVTLRVRPLLGLSPSPAPSGRIEAEMIGASLPDADVAHVRGPLEGLASLVRRALEELRARGVRSVSAVVYYGAAAPEELVNELQGLLEAEGLEVELRRLAEAEDDGAGTESLWIALEEA